MVNATQKGVKENKMDSEEKIEVVYIAGPYRAETIRGVVENIRRAEAVALEYWLKGFAVICPHLNTRLFDGAAPDEIWLRGDMEILRRCDVMVLVPGWERSKGTQAEYAQAVQWGKKVVFHKEITSE